MDALKIMVDIYIKPTMTQTHHFTLPTVCSHLVVVVGLGCFDDHWGYSGTRLLIRRACASEPVTDVTPEDDLLQKG